MRDAFQNYDDQRWGAAERPRRFGLQYELVIFIETGGQVLMREDGMSPPAVPLLMRRMGGEYGPLGTSLLHIPFQVGRPLPTICRTWISNFTDQAGNGDWMGT